MQRGRNDYHGRGGGRGGGRRGNRNNQAGNPGRGYGQNRGGGRGRNDPNRGSHYQPPAPTQLAPPAPAQPVSGIRPQQTEAPQHSSWTVKTWGPSSSTAPAPVDQPLTTSPVPAPPAPAQPVSGIRPLQTAAPQQSAWTGKRWVQSPSAAAAPVDQPLTPSSVPAPPAPAQPVSGIRPLQTAAPHQSAWTGKRWVQSPSAAPAPVDQPLTPSPVPAPPAPAQPVSGIRPLQTAAPQQSAWTGKRWVQSPSAAPAPVDQPLTPSPVPAPSQPTASAEKTSSSSSQSKEVHSRAIRRPDPGKLAHRRLNISVNHFPVFFDGQRTIYHYNVVVVLKDDGSTTGGSIRKSEKRIIRDKAFPQGVLRASVYDGEKNIFSAVQLEQGSFDVEVGRGEEGVRSGLYTFTITGENKLELSELLDYFGGSLPAVPRHTLQGLDLVMKENPRICFFRDQNKVELTRGLLAYKGFRSSLKPTGQGLALCLDYSVLAFAKALPVIDYLKERLRGFSSVDNVIIKRKEEVGKALIGMKVKVTHRTTEQTYVIVGLSTEIASETRFEVKDEGGNLQEMSVVQYFREKYRTTIRDIPCLNVGKRGKPNFVPMEFCKLVKEQRLPIAKLDEYAADKLKKLTLVPPQNRSKTISDMVRAHYGPYGDVARNFGIHLSARNAIMTKVEGRVIGAPELRLGGGASRVTVDADRCQWNLLQKSFVEAKPLHHWALLDFTSGDEYRLDAVAFVYKLKARCRNLGIQMADQVGTYFRTMEVLKSFDLIKKLLQDIVDESNKTIKRGRLQMIVCAMNNTVHGYKYLKWVSEIQIGVVTQCFLSRNANRGNNQYLSNLCLKINAKLGGNNFEVSGNLLEADHHVMFIGADVNHPAATNNENPSPSIAAVVGSMNWPAANRYAARISPQACRCETIKNFGEMCKHLVTAYLEINKVRPKRIVVFRDGVGDGQFEMVLGEELVDLKSSIYTIDYKPLITVIVAQKRHQTRFFLTDNRNVVVNVPPGTVVDTDIVHPRDFDFYLCSHYGEIGTSKPTHYYVLYDGNGFTSDQLQKLIYEMCFTFVRCTKPVSLVPPIYYADLVAYRGRMYQEVVMETQHAPAPAPGSASASASTSASASASASSPSFDQRFYSLHANLENMMFFV